MCLSYSDKKLIKRQLEINKQMSFINKKLNDIGLKNNYAMQRYFIYRIYD